MMQTTIGDVADFVRGVTYKKAQSSPESKPGYVPILRATNLQDGTLILNTDLVYMPEANVKPEQLLTQGDVVIATSSGSASVVGKSGHLGADWFGSFGAFCGVLRPREDVLSEYLYWYVQSGVVRQQWSVAARGTNINNLKRRDVLNTEIPIPSLEEQRRIVTTLEQYVTTLYEGLATIRAALAKLRPLTISVLRDAIDGWGDTTVGSVASVQLGRQRSPKNHSGPNMRPYVRAANITWDGLAIHDVKEMNFDDQDYERFRLAAGDILITEGSGSPTEVGKAVFWNNEIDGCCFQNTVLRVQCGDAIDRRYMKLVLDEAALSGRWIGRSRGVNIIHIGKAGLAAYPVPLPPLADQVKIVERTRGALLQVDKMRSDLVGQLARVEVLRSSVLKTAFSGDLASELTEAV